MSVAIEVSGAMPTCPTPGHVAVYRLYDEGGDLLYVGISGEPMSRWRGHAGTKAWWPDVATFRVRWYSSLREAEDAEVVAVRDEKPKHNGTYNRLPHPRRFHKEDLYDRILERFGYGPFSILDLDEQLGCPYSSAQGHVGMLRSQRLADAAGTVLGPTGKPRGAFRLLPRPSDQLVKK